MEEEDEFTWLNIYFPPVPRQQCDHINVMTVLERSDGRYGHAGIVSASQAV